jgi:arabinan endo-1,5-alpha-L-arabinosidase
MKPHSFARTLCLPCIAILSFAILSFGIVASTPQLRAQAPAAATALAQPAGPTTTPRVHDPSTIVRDGNLFYVYSTGPNVPFLSSPDLHTWTRRGSVFTSLPEPVVHYAPGNDGKLAWAPDIIKVGDTFLLYYAVSKWGSFASAVGLATNTTLDPDNPHYKWVDRGMVVSSDGIEDLNAIDPGVIHTPNGQLWLCYGSYHGSIELVQLDPKTGQRIAPASPITHIARGSEAADLIAHDGWFYLFVNHGSCCQGAKSQYHINVGRSRSITGPYLDRDGKPLTSAAGEPFMATDGDHIGPGHFGRVLGTPSGTPELFSIHYEAESLTGGKPALSVHLLQWSPDGWPIAGPVY